MAYPLIPLLALAGARKKSKRPKNLIQFKTVADMEAFAKAHKIDIEAKTLPRPWAFLIEVPGELTKRLARKNPDLLFTSVSRDVGNDLARKLGGPLMPDSEWGVGSMPITGPGAYQGGGGQFPLPVDENIIDTFITYARTGTAPEGVTMGTGTGTGTGLFGFLS